MKYLIWSMLSICCAQFCQAQTYLGAGNDGGITVNSSSEFQSNKWSGAAIAANVVNGSGLDYERFMVARFLEQSTLGFERHHIDEVMNIGFEAWIDQQYSLPMSGMREAAEAILDITNDTLIQNGGDPQIRPNSEFFHFAWWNVNMTNNDLLRQKVAAALSEIFVVSGKFDLDELALA